MPLYDGCLVFLYSFIQIYYMSAKYNNGFCFKGRQLLRMKILSGLVLLLCIGGSFSHEGHSHGAPGGGAAGIPGTVTLPPSE